MRLRTYLAVGLAFIIIFSAACSKSDTGLHSGDDKSKNDLNNSSSLSDNSENEPSNSVSKSNGSTIIGSSETLQSKNEEISGFISTDSKSTNISTDNSNPNETNVIVTVNKNEVLFKSGFSLGATYTHYRWELQNSDAASNVCKLLRNTSTMQNQHIMGWGPGNPWPTKSSEMDFKSLDDRLNFLASESIGGNLCLTLCSAPGWMKGTDDWDMGAAVLDENVPYFAQLCAEIALRYKNVMYFQVWNEMKGYWNSETNYWDYERYTKMYNAVYTAIKAVRPDAKIGGFYMVVAGDGSQETLGIGGSESQSPVDEKTKVALQYWLKNSKGADFICIDHALKGWNHSNFYPTDEQALKLTWTFQKTLTDIRALTGLPIFFSEYYGLFDMNEGRKMDEKFTAVEYASIYYNMIMGAKDRDTTALFWIGDDSEITSSLFTDTNNSSGGMPTLHYQVYSAIAKYFSNDASICKSESTSDDLEVLATATKTLLINKRNTPITVLLNGKTVIMGNFDVTVVNTP